MMDKLILKEEDNILKRDSRSSPWKILVVDDEEGVHQVTTLALKNFNL